ncbi:MAG: DNA processing protein DprA [Acidimicrobiia bacterium]|nr:MAG: DNA processing protein DprA [Acidimicrobiia bacterium]
MSGGPDDERAAAALALVSLPAITPARLRRLLRAHGGPQTAVAAVAAGDAAAAVGRARDPAALARLWRARLDVPAARARVRSRRTRVWVEGDGAPFRDPGPACPPVLLGEGEWPGALDGPRVAVVGARAASPHGLADAAELGAVLAANGVTVVSGMAIGVDAAAHEGALGAGGAVVGVVATGLDVVYPRRNGSLFRRARASGLLVSEHAYGVPPAAARFPVRNRIIAALADAVVVVEAAERGGALITARHGAEMGRTVFAVPGSRRNRAAAGCNRLIADGAIPLLDPGDVLLAIGTGDPHARWHPPGPGPTDPDEAAVLDALGGEAATADQLARRCRLAPGRIAGALRRLAQRGLVEHRRGRWWPR